MTDGDVYDDRVIAARDVCSNCFRLLRVERVDPTRGGLTREYEASYEREQRNTSIEYGPAEVVSEHKGVFCECGVESPRERIWGDADVDRDRLATLLAQLLRTLRRKGLRVATRPAARRPGTPSSLRTRSTRRFGPASPRACAPPSLTRTRMTPTN